MSLAGKTLFITGASRGIGKAIALRAARDGANVAIVAKTERAASETAGHDLLRRRGDRSRGRASLADAGATSATTPKSPRRRSAARSTSAASTSWSTTRARSASPARSRRR